MSQTCPTHPFVRMYCPACIGTHGGMQKSEKKTQAARRNAAKARPRTHPPTEGPVAAPDDGRP